MCADWAELEHQARPARLLAVRAVPHPLLFPRVAAIVHHGGAGTTATAARAGVPQIIVPHVGDQFFHGRRVHDLGLGPRPIPRWRLTERHLGAAVAEVLGSRRMLGRARSLGEQLRHSDGVGKTIAALMRR